MAPRKPKTKNQPVTDVNEEDERIKKEEEKKKNIELRNNMDEETEYSLDVFSEALEIEQTESSRMYKKYDQKNMKITKNEQNEYFYTSTQFHAPQNAENLCLKIQMNRGKIIYGSLKSFSEGSGIIMFSVTEAELDTNLLYSIGIETNRKMINSCLDALNRITDFKLVKFFTNFEENIEIKKKRNIKPPSKWFNKKVAEDPAQKNAVLRILSESTYPFPLVITGGPGTGKSSVIVETILQILDKKSFAHVLVTAQSNSACDEVAMRLRAFVPAVKVFRYWGPTAANKMIENRNYHSYFAKLSENSSILDGRTYKEPLKENIVNFKIVVMTMTTVNRLIRNNFPNDHFDFIFIDECCAAMEPECLIPIVGLGMSLKKVNANVILVGDDHLLGPVLYSSIAASMGLEQSLLERIMRLEAYKSESSTRVVKLVNNYRSHPEIIKYSNETFYESSMEQMVSSEIHNFAKGWIQLPNPDIPVIFHSVEAEAVEAKEIDGLSKFNIEEIEHVVEYVESLVNVGLTEGKKVKQNQIGIASPYTAQVKRLRERLYKDYPLIDVGTAEFYQGREKPVMIITAVRTNNLDSNFMDNHRRLNVLLTRAQSLMIIIGNVRKLNNFVPWESFIDHCMRNGLVRTGHLDDDGTIERIHTIQINTPSDEETSLIDADNDVLSLKSEKDDNQEEKEEKEVVKIFERLNWADEIE